MRVLPPEVVTVTLPEVAPDGTVAVISVAETAVNVAEVPLKFTAVAPVKPVAENSDVRSCFSNRGDGFDKRSLACAQPENGAEACWAPAVSGSVQISVRGLKQRSQRFGPIVAIGLGAKAVKRL